MKNKVLKYGSVAVFFLSLAFSLWRYFGEGRIKSIVIYLSEFWILPTVAAVAVLLLIFDRKEVSQFFSTFRRYIPLANNLVSRDLKVKYRRSILGFLWSVLNPLLMALVINTVFSKMFRFDVQYFATYYLCGSLLFNFTVEATSGSMTSVIDSCALIKKVYLPKYIFSLEKCVFALINMLFSCVAVVVVMLIQRCPFYPTALLFFVPMIYAFVFAFGFGLILSAVTVYFRDVLHLYSVFTMVWMYLTPIIYPIAFIEQNGLLGKIVRLNPMYYFVSMFRNIVMYNTLPSCEDHLICLAFALGFLSVGIFVFKKLQGRFIFYI